MDSSVKYIHDLIELDPKLNDFLKIKEFNHLRSKPANTFLSSHNTKEYQLNQSYKKLLSDKNNKTYAERLLERDLDKLLHLVNFPDNYFPITPLNNYLTETMSEVSYTDTFYQFTDAQSYKDYMKRLSMIPSICNSMISGMKQGMKHKMTYPRRIVLQLILQLHDCLLSNNLNNKFNHSRKIPTSIRKQFLQSVQKNLVKQIQRVVIFLTDEYLLSSRIDIGLGTLTNGKKLYQEIVSSFTFDDYTPQKVHTIGETQVDLLMKELQQLQTKCNFQGNYAEFCQMMKDNPKSQFKNTHEVLSYLKKLQHRIYKETFLPNFNDTIQENDMYHIKCVPEVNKHMSAYYQLPDFNNERKGTFFVNAIDVKRVNKDEMLVLSVHEGIPGHHYEHLFHHRNNQSLYMRATGYTSYSEGWALYCEGLSSSKNEREEFWRLIYSLHRALRLLIDTGIHWYDWSYEKCFLLMKKYLPFTDEMIQDEIYRYIDDPGQALCYTIGALTFYDLREKFLKKNNNIQDFHKFILELGPCPLDVLVDEFNDRLSNQIISF